MKHTQPPRSVMLRVRLRQLETITAPLIAAVPLDSTDEDVSRERIHERARR